MKKGGRENGRKVGGRMKKRSEGEWEKGGRENEKKVGGRMGERWRENLFNVLASKGHRIAI